MINYDELEEIVDILRNLYGFDICEYFGGGT